MTSKSDQRRYDALHRIGCMCCRKEGLGWRAPDAHHLVDKGYRRLSGGNKATLPLCEYHHRGIPFQGFVSSVQMEKICGPSMALRKKAFVRKYGTERELLAEVDALIAGMHS